ncbi:MAG: hypothetical protein CL608_12860 [Anaerolineaceae bacterium]|nr:hypothetical protein [Anaerolineaceae bacterium]
MKHYLSLSIFFILLLAACQPTPADEPSLPTLMPTNITVEPTPTLAEATTEPGEATAVPTQSATAESTAEPVPATATPTQAPVSNPQFSNLALLPNRASLSAGWPQPYTPIATDELYAVWNYSGMTAADQLERLWYYNGDLWLERSEAWDMNKYGANGRVEDIYVYDYEPNLPPGHYRVVLKVNGVELASAEHTIPANTVGPKVEPNSGFTAAVQNNKTLVLRRVDGTTASWNSFGDIVDFAWLPGGQGIVYTEQIVVNAELPGTLGLRHNLWLQNVVTGQKHQLGSTDEDLHTPIVSPDGRYLALYSGTLYGDACGVDADLHIMELTADLQRANLIDLADFSGFPVVAGAIPQPNLWGPGDGPAEPIPGKWVDGQTLEARVIWICAETKAHGTYQLDINDRTVEKVANLNIQ